MKTLKQTMILGVAVLALGLNQAQAAKNEAQNTGAILLSAGEVGPKGRVILAFRDGDKITFRVCADHTILGETADEAKKNCLTKEGTKDVVPLQKELKTELPKVLAKVLNTTDEESIKQIREMFEAQDPNMAPDGSKLAELYKSKDNLNNQIKDIDQKVKRIDDFSKKYGEKNADLDEKKKLLKQKEDVKTQVSTLDKEIAALEKDRESLKKEVAHLKDLMKRIEDQTKNVTDLSDAERDQCESVRLSDVLDHLADQNFYGTGVIWDDIAKDKNGKVLIMNQYDAEKYCANLEKDGKTDWRLPTVREQALLSQSMGAKGIKETQFAEIKSSDARVSAEITQMGKDNYYPIYKKNAAGDTVVDFYFNYSGYQKPDGDLGQNWFWSSSVHPYDSSFAYVLSGRYGSVSYDSRDDSHAVRCVRSR